MKQYIKPAVDVVELAVRESIAALPAAIVSQYTDTATNQTVTLTTYNLAAQQTSDKA